MRSIKIKAYQYKVDIQIIVKAHFQTLNSSIPSSVLPFTL